jgi:hypothetical protein
LKKATGWNKNAVEEGTVAIKMPPVRGCEVPNAYVRHSTTKLRLNNYMAKPPVRGPRLESKV